MEFLQEPTNWVAFSFILFMLGFARWGWKAAAGKLDQRIDEIKLELEQAETLHREAQSILANHQRRHAEAMREAQDIVQRARAQADTMRAKAEADLKETLARREKQLQERLARIEADAEAEMRRMTAAVALKASEELIRKSLDAKAQGALVEKSIASLPNNLN